MDQDKTDSKQHYQKAQNNVSYWMATKIFKGTKDLNFIREWYIPQIFIIIRLVWKTSTSLETKKKIILVWKNF